MTLPRVLNVGAYGVPIAEIKLGDIVVVCGQASKVTCVDRMDKAATKMTFRSITGAVTVFTLDPSGSLDVIFR